MKATEANFLRFLQGSKQFIIPIYQRTYSWTQKECEQLWRDIVRAASDPAIPAHFVGSIVYIEGGIYQVSAVPELLVIDGQQRLTTLTILLATIARKLENAITDIGITKEEIIGEYLLNTLKKGDLRYKLILTQSDEITLKQLVEGKEFTQNSFHRIVENYQYFNKQIDKNEIPLETLYAGIMKLVIVDVSLDITQDNPQLIFESMNSIGLELTQADLIRNYVLMGLENGLQRQIYQDYWYPMEQRFGHNEYARQFDRFMRDYLTIKNKGMIPRIDEVYEEFKEFVLKKGHANIQSVVKDVYRYSKHFVRLALQQETDKEIRSGWQTSTP